MRGICLFPLTKPSLQDIAARVDAASLYHKYYKKATINYKYANGGIFVYILFTFSVPTYNILDLHWQGAVVHRYEEFPRNPVVSDNA